MLFLDNGKLFDSFVIFIFCFRKVMLLKLCFVSMLTIDLRFDTFFVHINYEFDVSLCSSFINSLVNNSNTLFFYW